MKKGDTDTNSEKEIRTKRLYKSFSSIISVLKTYVPEILHSKYTYFLLIVQTVLSIGISLVPLALPYLSKIVIDEAIPRGAIKLFSYLAATAAVIYFLMILFRISSSYVDIFCETILQKNLRERVFKRMLDLPMYVQRTRALGSISRRLIDDIETYSSVLVKTIPTVVGQIIMFIILCIIISKMNRLLLVLMVISIPSILIINILSSMVYRKLFAHGEKIRDNQVNMINMAIEGFVSLISFGVIKQVKSLFNGTLEEEVALRFREWRVSAWKKNTEWLFSNGIGALALWTAWLFVLRRHLSLGEAVASIMYFGMILLPVLSITSIVQSVMAGMVAAGRLLEPTEFSFNLIQDNGNVIENEKDARYIIQLKNVCFRYPSSTKQILNNIALEIPDGCLIGLSGSSGVGKTTLGKLIAGHFKPTKGTICFTSCMTSITEDCAPYGVYYLPEDPFVLPASVKDNIEFYSQKEDVNRMQKCIHEACLSDVIEGLSNGIDTQLGCSNEDLSKGQKQRLMIARTLYAFRGKMIIFDDSTSNLDSSVEIEILNYMQKKVRKENITILFISHRKHVVDYCDIAYHMNDNGHITLPKNCEMIP